MTKESLSLGAMVLGLLLLATSFWWSSSTEPPGDWKDEDAQAYLDNGAKLHEMVFKVRRNGPQLKAGSDSTVSDAELAAQRKVFEEQQAKLDGARYGRKRSSWVMFGVGIVLTVGGLFAHKLSSE